MANATDTKRKSKENQHFEAHIIRTIKFEAPKKTVLGVVPVRIQRQFYSPKASCIDSQ